MKNFKELCPRCMSVTRGAVPCPACGFDARKYEFPQHHLRPGTILNGKYYAGNSIGEGGFGITYVGWEINLEMKVAIKEYFPSGVVSRDVTNTDTVTIFSGQSQEAFETGRNKFMNEAKILAKFEKMPGIVSVRDFFRENGTAYIVMEYIEGETLKSFLRRNGGRTSPETILAMLNPLLAALVQVHKQGLIHRDISPDNIMITRDSQVKLLDFGAARDMSVNGQRSLSIQLKPGYAPEEQYRTHGRQGPWTDVYAVCATIYRAITGVRPVEALERLRNDTLVPPSRMGVRISPYLENVLMQGMAVFAQNRIPDAQTLYNALYGGALANTPGKTVMQAPAPQPYRPQPAAPWPREEDGSSKFAIIVIAVLVAVTAIAVTIMILAGSGRLFAGAAPTETPAPTTAPTAAPTAVPTPQFTAASSSSLRGTDSEGGQYSTTAILYEDPTTKWAPSTSSGDGIGQWVQISAGSDQYIKGIKILNGYHKNAQTWRNNNRVQGCTVTFSSGESMEFTLSDTMDMITLDFGKYVQTSSVKLTINSVYYGEKWDDTAITYLGAY